MSERPVDEVPCAPFPSEDGAESPQAEDRVSFNETRETAKNAVDQKEYTEPVGHLVGGPFGRQELAEIELGTGERD